LSALPPPDIAKPAPAISAAAQTPIVTIIRVLMNGSLFMRDFSPGEARENAKKRKEWVSGGGKIERRPSIEVRVRA
jgi:hypothetical protein